MRARVAPVLLFALAACAGTSPAPAGRAAPTHPWEPSRSTAPASAEVIAFVQVLVGCETTAESRAVLEKGLEKRDFDHVGFDQISVAQSVERVQAALVPVREQPLDRLAFGELCDAADLYLAVRHELMVHRRAGAASCLPPMR